jgi:hypothetical protein
LCSLFLDFLGCNLRVVGLVFYCRTWLSIDERFYKNFCCLYVVSKTVSH